MSRAAVDAPRAVMPKHLLQQRLLLSLAKPGAQASLRSGLYLPDIAAFLHLGPTILVSCAKRKREIDDGLQVQLSNFFTLWDKGLLAKVKEGKKYEIVRMPAKIGAPEPAKATIDLSGTVPKIRWSR
jgi:hypothetical protein